MSLNIPAFLGGRQQLTKVEVKESQIIASVSIHVERAIQRIKKFRLIRNEILLNLHGNQKWTCSYSHLVISKTFSISSIDFASS